MEEYLGYAGLMAYLGLSLFLAVQLSRYMNDGSFDSGVGSFSNRIKVLALLTLLIGSFVGMIVYALMLLLHLCGVGKDTLDLLGFPILFAVFAAVYVIGRMVGRVMAA